MTRTEKLRSFWDGLPKWVRFVLQFVPLIGMIALITRLPDLLGKNIGITLLSYEAAAAAVFLAGLFLMSRLATSDQIADEMPAAHERERRGC